MMYREIKFRYHVLRNGAFYAYLRADESAAPTIRMNDADAIKTALTGTFLPTAIDADGREMPVNFLADEIQPVMIVNGVSYPLGVFMPAKVVNETRSNAERVNIQAYDRCWRVRDTRKNELLYWPSGTLYLDAIKQLLSVAGIKTVIASPNNAAFTEAREDWPLGESFLTVVNDLLKEINYKPLWFDKNGVAILEPVSIPTSANIEQYISDKDSDTMFIPDFSREADYYESPNVFIVYCANPDKSGNMIATARNDNPQSPLSVQRRGREITSVTQINNIPSQSELQARAEWLRNKSLLTGEILKPKTGLRPGFTVGGVVALQKGDLLAIGIEHQYTMPLQLGGVMEHTIERVVYNLE